MIIFLFYFNRQDAISRAADEVNDEINVSDEETYTPSKRKSKSKKKHQDDRIKLMKNSISRGNMGELGQYESTS
jgi:hypothetical protein